MIRLGLSLLMVLALPAAPAWSLLSPGYGTAALMACSSACCCAPTAQTCCHNTNETESSAPASNPCQCPVCPVPGAKVPMAPAAAQGQLSLPSPQEFVFPDFARSFTARSDLPEVPPPRPFC